MSLGFNTDDLPDDEIDQWNVFPWVISNNCWSYACNSPLTYNEFRRGGGLPGWRILRLSLKRNNYPVKLPAALEKTGLKFIGHHLEPFPGHYPIKGWVAKKDTGDLCNFHFERLGKNGYWSFMTLNRPAVIRTELGEWNSDPSPPTSDLKSIGFWAVPKGGLPLVTGRTTAIFDSGYEPRSEFMRDVKAELFVPVNGKLRLRPDFNPATLETMRSLFYFYW